MQESLNEGKEEEKAPTKKVRIRDDGTDENAETMDTDTRGEDAETMDADIDEEGAETMNSAVQNDNSEAMDEVMSLGSRIFQISQIDPVIENGLRRSERRTKP